MLKIFSSKNSASREPTFNAPLRNVASLYDIEADSERQLDGIRCGDVTMLMKKGRRTFPLGNVTVGVSSLKRGVMAQSLYFRVLQLRTLRVADAKAAGFATISAFRDRLHDIYGPLGPDAVFTQAWLKYVGEINEAKS